MEGSMRAADSGLDLDDSGSGNETFHSSDGGALRGGESQTQTHNARQNGKFFLDLR